MPTYTLSDFLRRHSPFVIKPKGGLVTHVGVCLHTNTKGHVHVFQLVGVDSPLLNKHAENWRDYYRLSNDGSLRPSVCLMSLDEHQAEEAKSEEQGRKRRIKGHKPRKHHVVKAEIREALNVVTE